MKYFENGYADLLMEELVMLNPRKCVCFDATKEGLMFRVLDPVEWSKEFLDKHPSKDASIIMRGRIIICLLDDGRHGEATCSPTDTFMYSIGIAIAMSRALGLELPRGL